MIEANTAEWFESRCGRMTASRAYDATARQKNGKHYAARAAYLVELATERLTGVVTQHYVSDAMRWGTEHEPAARAAYEYFFDATVAPVGFVLHPQLAMAGATPDGRDADVLVEFKCPTSATHVSTLLRDAIDERYVAQIDWQLACCPWAVAVDFVSFDPRMPVDQRFWCVRHERDDAAIALLESEVAAFLGDLDETVDKLLGVGRAVRAACG